MLVIVQYLVESTKLLLQCLQCSVNINKQIRMSLLLYVEIYKDEVYRIDDLVKIFLCKCDYSTASIGDNISFFKHVANNT